MHDADKAGELKVGEALLVDDLDLFHDRRFTRFGGACGGVTQFAFILQRVGVMIETHPTRESYNRA